MKPILDAKTERIKNGSASCGFDLGGVSDVYTFQYSRQDFEFETLGAPVK